MNERINNTDSHAQRATCGDCPEHEARTDTSAREENCRDESKRRRQEAIERSLSYRSTLAIVKYMDKYYLDPIIGFFAPGMGDILTSWLVLPFIYVSLFKIRSIPLTLAVVFNTLVDIAVGLIPWIGDFFDIMNRAYLKNSKLIVGFVEDDKQTIRSVNKKAALMAVLIVVMCFVIYWLAVVAFAITKHVADWFVGLFA